MSTATRSRRALTRRECHGLLREIGWGILAVAEGEGGEAVPVGVPIAYAFDAERIILALSPGRKLSALRRNPRCCLTVTDVQSLRHWRSVSVVGTGRCISDAADRLAVMESYRAVPRRPGWELREYDEARLARAHFVVIDAFEMHGFAAAADAHRGAKDDAPRNDPPTEVMNGLRRIVRSLRLAEKAADGELGVSAAQLFVLREVAKAQAIGIGELARRTATAQSSVSEVVTRLVTTGLVVRRRSPSDARRAEVRLSRKGHALLARAPETIQERLLEAFGRLPEDTQLAVAHTLTAWLDEAGLDASDAPMFFEG